MILVTGATGFIGSHLVERLAAQGRSVRCLVRRAVQLPAGVECAPGDLAAGIGLAEALRGVDTVIHLAGVTKALAAADYDRGNRLATANLLCAAAGVTRLVHVSSLAAAGPSPRDGALTEDDPPRPISLYGRSKLAGEAAVRASALAVRSIIIRPPVVYGPRDKDVFQVLRSVARGWMIEVGQAPSQTPRRFSHIYVGDLVDGLIAAADAPGAAGEVFYIANLTPSSWQEFAAMAARLMNRRFRIVNIPERAAYAMGYCAEVWSRLTSKPGILSRDKVREAVCPGWVCDPSRVRQQLGFCAGASLEEGLRRTLDWYKEAGWLRF